MQLNSLGTQLDEQDFLREGDQITISYHNYYLYSQGFNTSELSLKNFQNRNPISSIFVIESFGRQSTKQFRKSTSLIHYGQKILLLHLLSGKYLSYELHSSQEEVRLKYAKTSNCLFTIKPIFKCQANFARKIRKGQQICLQSSERLKLCIELGQRQGIESECLVTMKKHEESIVLIDRLNLPHRKQKQLSNLMVCQLSNVQTEFTLYAEKKDEFYMQVFFAENINLYGSFLTIESYQIQAIKQILVVPNQILCIQFYTSGLFLGFDQSAQIQLYSECREQCRFMFQNYDDDELKEQSIIKVKHISSGLYLGADKKQVTLGPFQLNKTFRLKRVDYSMLKITLLVNELHASFVSLLREKVIMQHRLQLEQLFKELLRFIYLPSFNEEHYYNMNSIKLKITSVEQNLLSKVGFIQLFISAYRQFLGLLNNGGAEHKTQSHLALSQIMLVLVGICHRNRQNTQILSNYLPVLYQGMSVASQIIDALYYIFQADNLEMLEIKQHHNKKGKIRTIQLLIQSIQRQRVWEVSVRAKLLRFLESIMIRNQGEKWVLHEMAVMEVVRGDRLRNILYAMTVVGEDIEVCLQDGKFELSDILMKKTKYSKQIDVIRAQLHFLCTLYSNPNVFNLALFRQQFPENVLFNYLKNNIPAEDHRIFLRMLNEIYLRVLPKVSSNIIFLVPEPEFRQRQNELKSLEKIKTIVVGKVKRSILNELIDEATQLSVRAAQRYCQLGLMEFNQWNQLLSLMQNFLLKNYRFSTNNQEEINLNLQILKIHEFVAEVSMDYFSKQLIMQLKEEIPKVESKRFIKTAEAVFTQILQEAEFNQQDRNRFMFLQKVIDHSADNSPNIFHTACRLMKMVNHRPYRIVERLKSLILIDSEQTKAIVVELHEHHLDLCNILGEYQRAQQRQRQLLEISFILIKKMQSINQYFYSGNSKQSRDSISPLVQNIMREIGIFATVMSFPKDQQRQLGTKRSNIFMELFMFIQLYLHNNETNLLACIRQFQSIKWLFTYDDVGQTKILYLLISNPISLKTLPQDLKLAALASMRHSEIPNCYGVLSILKVINDGGAVDRQYVCDLAKSFVSESGLLQNYWKINSRGEFIYQEESRQEQRYFKYFGYYIFLIIRLFLVLIQYCDCKEELIQRLKEKIRLRILIELMLQKDLLDQCSLGGWGLQLMKEEVISYYGKIYENYFDHVDAREIKYFIDKAAQINIRLLGFKNIEEIQIDEFAFTENDIESLQNECLRLKFKDSCTPTINLILIGTIYPFLVEFTNQLYLCGNSNQQTEIQSLWMQLFRRLKQLLSVLTKEEYRKFKKEYNRAILACEQVLKNKLGFQLQEDENQLPQKQTQTPINKIYRVEQLHNLLDNCQVLNDTDPKSQAIPVYKSIFVILYSPVIHQIIIKKSRIVNPLKGEQVLAKIVKVFLKSMQDGLMKGNECIQMFWLLAKEHTHLMKFIMTSDSAVFQQMIISALTSDTDNSNTVLNSCMKICNLMMKQVIDSQLASKTNIFSLSSSTPVRQVLHDRIRGVLQRQRLLYDQHTFQDHLQQCEANSNFNSEWIYGSSLVQNILKYITNEFIIAGHVQKDVVLFKEVLLLFRSYLRFVKQFNLVYMPVELHSKISICLQIIFNALSPTQQETVAILFQGVYCQEFNQLLKLDDSWDVSNLELDLTKEQYIMSIFTKLNRGWQKDWIQKLMTICNKSSEFYGGSITYEWGGFPLQPMFRFYGPLKRGVVLILKQLKTMGLPFTKQILLGLNREILKQNIINVYNKHYYLFDIFNLPSLNTTLKYPEFHRLHKLAASLCFENGIDLTSLKIYIDSLSDNNLLQSRYSKHCENIRSFNGVISLFSQFLNDFKGLFWGSEEQFQTKNLQYKIYEYFYSRMGRVQLLVDGKLITVDFVIRPECIIHSSDRESLMGELNFMSTQLKLSSISKSAVNFHILFNEYNKFLTRYRNFKIILFLQKYLILIKVINLLLVYLDNVYLLTNSQHFQQDYFDTKFEINDAFQILLLINFLFTVVYLLIYNLKNMPIMLAQLKESMQQQDKRFHKYSQRWTKLVLAREIFLDSQFIYNMIYLVVMGLVFVNKIVIALLTLDLLIQVQKMRELLSTLWTAKGQLLFAFIYFMLIHYFYVIFVYLFLNNVQDKYCTDISNCLGYVFDLSLRVVGGFPGYIYQQQAILGIPPKLNIYSFFGDIYLIIAYQIFSAVIIVIIVDSYSKLSRRKSQRKESLSLNCLVCGLSRTIFNASANLNFRTHIAVHHNVWNYIYYFHYLKSKPQSERNFSERLMMETSMHEWLPNGYSQGFQEPL